MGLFKALVDVASMPIRLGVDVAKLPGKILGGEDGLLENTARGLERIEEDLEN